MTGKKRSLRSDLKKVDRHVIQPHEYDQAPELSEQTAERADLCHGGRLIRQATDHLAARAAVLRWFQQSGPATNRASAPR